MQNCNIFIQLSVCLGCEKKRQATASNIETFCSNIVSFSFPKEIMAEQKISFSFKPLQKSKVVLPLGQDRKKDTKNDIELIQCIEDRSIKVVM